MHAVAVSRDGDESEDRRWNPNGNRAMSRTGDRDELLARIARSRATLEAAIGRLGEERLNGPTDEQGWTVKDHLTHIAAWERSMAYLLRGQARHEGLGVPEEVYFQDDTDAINAAIHERTADRSTSEALELFQDAHRQLLAALEPLTYEDLLKSYSHYLPNEPGDDDGSPIFERMLGNTEEHYDEHLAWIEALAR